MHEKLHQLFKPRLSPRTDSSNGCCTTQDKLKLLLLPKQLISVTGSEDDTFGCRSTVKRLFGDIKKSYMIVPEVQCFFWVFVWLFLLSTCSCISTWVLDVCVIHVLLLKDECCGSDLALSVWFRC